MAYTYPKGPMKLGGPHDSFEGYVQATIPEGANQTFPAGSPISVVGGYAVAFVNPTTALIWGFAITPGHNTAAGVNTVDLVLALPEYSYEINFLGSGAADVALAQADWGVKYDLLSNATLLATPAGAGTTLAGWFCSKTTADVSIAISNFRSHFTPPDINQSAAQVGDINARVTVRILPGKSFWF